MNALMYDPLADSVVDHWGGCEDIASKCIRHVDDSTFSEDPLRVLRTARFAAQLEFSVHKSTVELCKTIDISTISKERVFEETKKALLSKKPSVYFEVLKEMGHLDYWYPELKELIGVKQKEELVKLFLCLLQTISMR